MDLSIKLALVNNLVNKEVKKCEKYAKSVDILFKKYREFGAEHADTLKKLGTERNDKIIEKEIFQTL